METTWARSRTVLAGSVGARKVRHVQQSAHREVDLIPIERVYGSKPGLNLTSRLLRRHGQHIYTYICNYVIFSGFYCSMETSRIIRVGTRNNIIHIATVSQEHVLVTTARKVTRPENYMDLVLASKLTLLCGWSKYTWFLCGGSEITWFLCGDHNWLGFVWGSKMTWFRV